MHTLLLRGSGRFDLQAVRHAELDSGVEHGNLLGKLVDALIARKWSEVAVWRKSCVNAMGSQQTVDAIAVASAFNGITRIADATGIPLDAGPAEATEDMRAQLQINDFEYEEKSRKYGSVNAPISS